MRLNLARRPRAIQSRSAVNVKLNRQISFREPQRANIANECQRVTKLEISDREHIPLEPGRSRDSVVPAAR